MSELQVYQKDSVMPPLSRDELEAKILDDMRFFDGDTKDAIFCCLETLIDLDVLRTEPC